MVADTAARIAAARASAEGKEGIRSFLEKRRPAWTKSERTEPSARAKTARSRKK
jgi:1,4-dihydroxy-2-naphthoyl-CoA synthase